MNDHVATGLDILSGIGRSSFPENPREGWGWLALASIQHTMGDWGWVESCGQGDVPSGTYVPMGAFLNCWEAAEHRGQVQTGS